MKHREKNLRHIKNDHCFKALQTKYRYMKQYIKWKFRRYNTSHSIPLFSITTMTVLCLLVIQVASLLRPLHPLCRNLLRRYNWPYGTSIYCYGQGVVVMVLGTAERYWYCGEILVMYLYSTTTFDRISDLLIAVKMF